MTLEERFKLSLSRLENAEDIDALGLKTDKKGKRIADYLLFGREAILELKTLVEDAEHKVEATLDPHRNREDFPVFYGKVELDKILAYLPDGKDINEQVYGRVTRSTQKAFKSADAQIIATRTALGLDRSMGVLAILNENVDIFSPDIIAAKVSEMLTRKNEDGSYVHSQIASVVVISENHLVLLENGNPAKSIIVIDGPYADRFPNAGAITDAIMTSWATFNDVPLVKSSIKEVKELDFFTTSARKQEQEAIPLHEFWRRSYHKTPYLRGHTKEGLLAYGRQLIATIAPTMMVGGKRVPPDTTKKLMQQFGDFFEEMKQRGIDMREVQFSDGASKADSTPSE